MGLIGQKVVTLENTPSTNDYLKQQVSKSKPLLEGTVIMAVHQTAGRGQRGAFWLSDPGQNLTFSILLQPDFLKPMSQFSLTIAISIGIARALENYVDPALVSIKWPNDLLIGSQKLGGILIENVLQGTTWKYAIVGIGLNVNQKRFPAGFNRKSTSLAAQVGKPIDLKELLIALTTSLGEEYDLLRHGEQASQRSAYLRRLYRRGVMSSFLVDGSPVQGIVLGVTQEGKLQVDMLGGIQIFDIREIKFLD